MPIYEYKCLDCGTIIEVEHKHDEQPELVCKECGSKNFKKLIGSVGVILKGDGWYSKDAALEKNKIPKAVWKTAEKKGAV